MNEKVKKQQYQFMLYNLVAFSLIFTLFGVILYSQMRTYLYQPVESSLADARGNIAQDNDYVDRQIALPLPAQEKGGEGGRQLHREDTPFKNGPRPPEVSMRIQAIVRDAQGEVLNPHALGRIYFDGYLASIPQPTSLDGDSIELFQAGGGVYLALAFRQTDAQGNPHTIQLLANVDGEQAVLDNFVRLLVLCIIVFVLLSLLASYLLSKKSMAPIIRSWNRQTEFVENASHELRTPLTIIQNKLEALLTHPDATVMDKAEQIGVSLGETRRLSKLTADLMTLARADSNETQLEKEAFPLDRLIAQVCDPYGELAQLQGKTLRLELDYARDLRADKSRIHELMVILLDNALKYTGEGDAIHVRTRLTDGRCVIEVEDSGIGIPEEARRRVFDRFYRADKARSREAGGSGLGLSIAQWIVNAHEGSIAVHPAESGGTVFLVRLKP